MKKFLWILLAVIVALPLIFLLLLWLAFGPIYSERTIDYGPEGELICFETYNADLAAAFYDVKMIMRTSSGKKIDIGEVTFNDMDWYEGIRIKRYGEWLLIFPEPMRSGQIKMLNTVDGRFNDTTLVPLDLRKDILYKKNFRDKPDHLYPGSCKILNITDSRVEVSYRYRINAAYPSSIVVEQNVEYEINLATGVLQTKAIHDRLIDMEEIHQ